MMRIVGKVIACILLWFLSCGTVWGLSNANIQVLTMRDGLADNTVWSIFKDSDGFMWFGTENGLSRFDGKVFTSFSHPEYFAKVEFIQDAQPHALWYVSNGNLEAFNREQDCFLPIEWEESAPVLNDIQQLCAQSDSTIWALQNSVLYGIDVTPRFKEGFLVAFKARVRQAYPLHDALKDEVQTFCFTQQGQLALVTRHGGLVIADSSQLEKLHTSPIIKWLDGDFRGINSFAQVGDYLWLSTNLYGAFSYHLPTGSIRQYTYSDSPSSALPHTDVYAVTPLPYNGGFFLATWSGYTLLQPSSSGVLEAKVFDISTDAQLKEHELRMLSAFCDTEGNLWAGTRGGGVLRISTRDEICQQIFLQRHNVFCALEYDNDHYLWAATFHDGIMRSTGRYNGQDSITLQKVSASPTQEACYSVAKDTDGSLWFGYAGGLLLHMDPTTGNHTHFQIATQPAPNTPPSAATPTETPDIWALYLDREGHLLAGTSNGLYLVNRSERTAVRLFDGFHVFALTATHENTYWVGTAQGLVHYNPKTKELKTGYDPATLKNKSIRSVFFSSHGDLYIGYENGLGVISHNTDALSAFYTTRDGLSSNFIGCITQDDQGRIWIGSNSGITYFNKDLQLFHNFYVSGNYRSVLNLNRRILWGTNRDIIALNPLSERFSLTAHNKTFITQLEVNNEPVVINEARNGQIILSKGAPFSEGITLNPRNFRFSVLFNNFSYSQQEQRFQYRLYPYEKEWRLTTGSEKVSYARLPHGKYTLQANSMSPDGTLGPMTSFSVTIRPKWTETVWFFLGCILLFLATMAFIWARLNKSQERKERETFLQQEMQRITQERRHEEQLHRERINLFTNISHELRTPLSLIIAPLKDLLRQSPLPAETWRDKLKLMEKNATLLSSTVDQILYLQKMEAKMVEPVFSPTDLVTLTRQEVAAFSDLAGIKHIALTTDVKEDALHVYADAQQMASAIRNILSNALKYTPDGGKVHVALEKTLVMETPCCRISISDNGPGIQREDVAHIFDPFSTSANQPTFSNKMGIGLKTVKNIMDLHRGNIEISTQPGQGSTFTLNIPILGEAIAQPDTDTHVPSGDTALDGTTAGDTASASTSPNTTSPKTDLPTMLIIEDNADMQAYLNSLFNKEFRICQAYNGQEGLQKALQELPHIILCDVMMPVMDGFRCCQAIRSHPQTFPIPILMLTAKNEEVDVLQCLRHGADDYLMKPFNPAVLEAKVHHVIRLRDDLEAFYQRTLSKKKEAPEKSLFMKQIVYFVEQNLSNSELSVKDIANELNISNQTLFRKLKKETDLSATELIRAIRISKAASLLTQQKYAIPEIAEMVGYNDTATFREHFKKRFGVVPSQFMASEAPK